MTYISHGKSYIGAWLHTHTHTHTRIMRLLRLSLNIRQAPVWFCGKLGGSCLDILIEGKSHYRLAVGKKNMINAKTGQWMIVTRIRYIRMLTDYVPAGPRRRREVLLESPSPSTDTLTTATWKEQSNRPWLKVNPERRIKLHLYMFCMYVCVCLCMYVSGRDRSGVAQWCNLFIKMSFRVESGCISHIRYIIRKKSSPGKCWQGVSAETLL